MNASHISRSSRGNTRTRSLNSSFTHGMPLRLRQEAGATSKQHSLKAASPQSVKSSSLALNDSSDECPYPPPLVRTPGNTQLYDWHEVKCTREVSYLQNVVHLGLGLTIGVDCLSSSHPYVVAVQGEPSHTVGGCQHRASAAARAVGAVLALQVPKHEA